jgi:arsenate reductase
MPHQSVAQVLAYANCDTCRKALRWLTEHGIAHTVRPIVEAPPTVDELVRWVPASGASIARWFNTSGQSYRALGKAVVDAMTNTQKHAALAADGKLVRRPVLVRGETVLVGFDVAVWTKALM